MVWLHELSATVSPAIDIYSFGMCALEMAALEIQGNGDSGTLVTEDHISRTIDSLDDPLQKDFIRKCLGQDPESRPPARDLLFHSLLFEVHSLKLLAAHTLVNGGKQHSLIVALWILCYYRLFSVLTTGSNINSLWMSWEKSVSNLKLLSLMQI